MGDYFRVYTIPVIFIASPCPPNFLKFRMKASLNTSPISLLICVNPFSYRTSSRARPK